MNDPAPRFERADYARDPRRLARDLLGQRLVRIDPDGVRLSGVIVETEAYLGVRDRAAHSFGGRRTARNESMYGPPGRAYVYFTYGMHWMLNIVCGAPGEPVAVLVRALEPQEGAERMAARRSVDRETLLCSGPARLCEALAIDRALDGHDLAGSRTLFVERVRTRPLRASSVAVGPRIGVGYAGEWAAAPLRWLLRGNAHVSRPAGVPGPLPRGGAGVPSGAVRGRPRAAGRSDE